ncbi:hypothetical protein AHF37_07529 [Paragonimus kellicotti]|nr:hypothetical protein AHF37_07529 [Paragonimus kellicotti]
MRLKNVLQRTLAENERLKCAPGIILQEENRQMKGEIVKLRAELETAQLAVGARLAEYRMVNERSVLRLSQEYENLRKSYEEVGESGKTPKELEKIIMRLKNVLQRTLAENERLKCAPGIILQEENRQMKGEIVKLRAELETAQLAVGARLAEYRMVNERSVLRLSQEYENLRKSYEEVSTT